MRTVLGFLIALTVAAGCVRGEHREAREKYNAGVAALAAGDLEAAEKALLDARSEAGVDPELRFRAAYDLGVAFAAHADKVKTDKDADLAKALELEQQAAWWFGDALRLRSNDQDTITNLAIVRARVQALSDELRKGEGKLEARLDALIGQQRGVLDEIRAAWREIAASGGADPLSQQGPLVALANRSRGIVAEAGVISDLASDEIDAIGKKPDDKRDQDEQMRLVQLKNLDLYVGEARARIGETRRELQQLSADTALAKAEAALVALKRAREQLFDPITILQIVLKDQGELAQETAQASLAGRGAKLTLDSSKPGSVAPETPRVEAWLSFTALAGRQTGIRDRAEEVRARLATALEQPAPPQAAGSAVGAGSDAPAPPDPKREKLLAKVKVALPSIVAATTAMGRAHAALLDKQWKQARDAEDEAILSLFAAIEQFADLKHTVDLAWTRHQLLLSLLVAPAPAGGMPLPDEESPAERAKRVHDEIAGNVARVERIKQLIADELHEVDTKAAELEQQAATAPPGSGSGAAPDPKQQQLEAARAQIAQTRQLMARAEELRGQARTQLAELEKAIAAPSKERDPITVAKAAEVSLHELRKLFFDVVEHLKELIREQSETKERTGVANGEDDFARDEKLPGLIERQDGHGKIAKAITDALAQQADAATKQAAQPQQAPQPGAPSPEQQAKTFSAAAGEVRSANNDMSDAQSTLTKTKASTAAMAGGRQLPGGSSLSLEPATKRQTSAIEHLEKALQLLQPPPKNDKKNEDKQDQKQDQPKPDQKQDPKPDKDQQQGGAAQRARDEDAKRQKNKRDRGTPDQVDQDW